ncbi:alkene reductase [Parahaliea sp. F7430]|uniref:Alkene reductase n=1 Tax=Sediminihaliea albiluteola TaxID=2758564 RepID=A0A7W2TVJ7_9GAMM|nr:alkene reductase [Sediminihaliea albiluteola]MBA6412678.1 alkene reductase [Sediminihaliea albiluteola]
MSDVLFSPTTLGSIKLSNRIAMGPMTRARTPNTVPNSSNATYYAQRASAGLIITEATQVSIQGTGTINTPGIYTPEQVAGWKAVTDAVHAAGGRIVCQIWHSGRVSHSCFQENGQAPVSSSAVRGDIRTFTPDGFQPTSQPRALDLEEIAGVVEQYRLGARNAIEAGFDGVEIHAANGYLIDQFLRDGVNQRDDEYGGSVANRCRFLLEVTDAVIAEIGAERTGVRLSPFSSTWDCHDSDPRTLYLHAVSELNSRNLAFLELVEEINESEVSKSTAEAPADFSTEDLLPLYKGQLILNGGYNKQRAQAALVNPQVAAISIARPYMCNPDLVERFANDAELAPMGDPALVYGGGDEGYIDFPSLEEVSA